MADKSLKRMTRRELLEMLVAQGKEAERLQSELDAARAELNDRKIKMEKAGSLAEAALSLNGVFEAAEAAARQYLENIQADAPADAKKIKADTATKAVSSAAAEAEAKQIIERAKKEAAAIIADAEAEKKWIMEQADSYVHSAERKLQAFYTEHPELYEPIG